MPLYEYACRDCRHRFETLVRNGVAPACPACGGAALDRLVSTFGLSTHDTRQSNLQQARRQSLKTERDKAVAQAEYEQKHAH